MSEPPASHSIRETLADGLFNSEKRTFLGLKQATKKATGAMPTFFKQALQRISTTGESIHQTDDLLLIGCKDPSGLGFNLRLRSNVRRITFSGWSIAPSTRGSAGLCRLLWSGSP
ncbi:hypothetical protein PCASD_05596 [Puccinia coronata f. sp. avenae]|uniref:Uncharacterized protein n=1 Tax=Puccinia coronata f. sp. avenae TaxID=200324 RepID=A0A2N5UWT8_9BASI|nr:hypothetical protein PCASD_05596 [Puccinia coronata f. sp. avenae]